MKNKKPFGDYNGVSIGWQGDFQNQSADVFFESIKENINEDISSTNVNFSEETLDMVKERQTPKESTESSSGKNPFSPL